VIPQNLAPQWHSKLTNQWSRAEFKNLMQFLDQEISAGKSIYPAQQNILRVFIETDLPDVRVVILGQDPYHGIGQAIGRSFAVPNELSPKPPSLKNILNELQSDLGKPIPNKMASDLSGWANQGVLLLNTVLTVQANQPLSHRDRGWEQFTATVIELLGQYNKPIVFILWGSHAQKFKEKINLKLHLVIESPHPSPLSAHRGFFGSKPFSKANQALENWGLPAIDWYKITDENTDENTAINSQPIAK
jgi:uracil-DNA glycosylase